MYTKKLQEIQELCSKLQKDAGEPCDGFAFEQIHEELIKTIGALRTCADHVRTAGADGGSAELKKEIRYAVAWHQVPFVREGECEIDDSAIVSTGGDAGAYVQAWVWVSDDLLDSEEEKED